MTDKEQAAIGANLAFAVLEILQDSGVEDSMLVANLAAEAVLVRLDQAGYQITMK